MPTTLESSIVANEKPEPKNAHTGLGFPNYSDLSNEWLVKHLPVSSPLPPLPPPPPHVMTIDGLSNHANAVPLNIAPGSGGHDEKVKPLYEAAVPRGHKSSSFFQATLNCVSMLLGLGMLSSPFAVAQAGWMGAIIALIISASYAYASHLMAECVRRNGRNGDNGDGDGNGGDGDGGSYEEVARAAFGPLAERVITALFYAEILGVLVGYCISVGDNLAHIFPAGLGRFELPGVGRGRNLMMLLAALLVLPTVWLRDLRALSFTSMWCIVTSCCLLLSVLLGATVDGHIGFSHALPFLRVRGLPVAAGLYAFSFGGTSVFPSIYMSMEDPSKFSTVIALSFSIVTCCMVGLGIAGAHMFGIATSSQVTLNMPVRLVTSKVILWMTVLTPMLKFALQLSPITAALELQIYRLWKKKKQTSAAPKPPIVLYAMGTLVRSLALAAIVAFAMLFPYFEYIVAFVGSSMTIAICLVLPCLFYLKFFWADLRPASRAAILALVAAGAVVGACGTVISVRGLIATRSST